jgi:signal transduction histidine kinase
MYPSTWHTLASRLRSMWMGWSLVEQFTIVALLAVVCATPVFVGWGSAGGLRAAVAVVELAMVALLMVIVGRASEAIADHQRAAGRWSAERSRLLEENADLRHQVDESHRRAVEINDKVLRRVGVELHDGPAQFISLALLRLDSLRPDTTRPNGGASIDDFERIRGALREALAEIRSMSAGLTLPELSGVSASDALRLAVRNHERRTATSVACDVEGLPQHLPASIKSCLYRFAQEALNNAYRHANGRGQAVRGRRFGNTIEVEVADAGPGFEPDGKMVGSHLGLLGMRERVASLGGTLEIKSRPGSGTRLTTRFEISEQAGSQG